MTQYLLSIYQPDGPAPDPERLQQVMRDVGTFIEELRAAGALAFHGGLHPPSASTVVRHRRGKSVVTDGPFIESKEHLGGLVVVKAENLDDALSWAGKLARALTLEGREDQGGLAVEVRPFQG